MKNGFTLIELIFAIVIIGVLSAVAVPKFASLKDNAEVSNMVKAVAQIQENGRSAYLNETELNGIAPADLNLSNMFDFRGNGWTGTGTDGDPSVYTADNGDTMTITYVNPGTVTIAITGTISQTKVADKTGLSFTTTQTIDLK